MSKDPAAIDGDLDFSDGELVEMGADVAGREAAPQGGKKRRSQLRIPADEIRRPEENAPIVGMSTEPSMPAFNPTDPSDELVEHAFHNGGAADGVVPGAHDFTAAVMDDWSENAASFRSRMEEAQAQVREMEAEPEDESVEIDTDPKALALRGDGVPRPVEDTPTSPLPQRPASPASSPGLAALVRAVTAPPPAPNPWVEAANQGPPPPPSLAAVQEPLWSSAPSPGQAPADRPVVVGDTSGDKSEPAAPGAKALASAVVGLKGIRPANRSDDTPMEIDGADLEEDDDAKEPPVAAKPPIPAGFENRSKTPLPPPPPGMDSKADRARSLTPMPPQLPPERQRTLTPVVPLNGGASPPAIPAAASNGNSQPISIGPQGEPGGPPPMPPKPPPAPQLGSATTQPMIPVVAPPDGPPRSATPPPAPAPAHAKPPLVVPAVAGELPLRTRKRRRAKQWFEEIFNDDYLRTLPFLTPRQTEREAAFIAESLGVEPGAALLDLACGYGRHAMELAAKNYKVTGLDLSLPLLIRAADTARRASLNINFIHGDMREMTFENEFDGAYSMFTSFGYFDDDTNRKVAANLARAIKPGGKLLIDVVNRDYLCRDLPTRVWWQGEGCVILEEVDFNYFSSRLQVQRSIIFEDGRQVEQEISIRAYSLHEIGKVLHHSGFRVTEVSGGLSLRGKFFGAQSRQLIVLAEKKALP